MKKKNLLVVGMHRSGTSALTGVLNAFGAAVPLAANTRISADNPKGHWEHTAVNRINDDILRQFGLTWACPDSIATDQIADEHKNGVRSFLDKAISGADADIVAFKDPRFCLLLPLWLDQIQQLGHDPVIIFSCRSPQAVAKSIEKRNNMGLERGLYLWLQYNLQAIVAMRNYPCMKLVFPEWTRSPADLYRDMAAALDLDWPQSLDQCETSANEFIDQNLVHNTADVPSHSLAARACNELFAVLQSAPADCGRLSDQSDFIAFHDRHLEWLTMASALIQDERNLWREKINSLYYLINRNS